MVAEQRLQKILALAGFGSRRNCEALIASGRVSVNGSAEVAPGTKADLERDDVRVDGRPVKEQSFAYYMLNKPAGCVTTMRDDRPGRGVVSQYTEALPVRVYPVGRLDMDTEGLLLLTNDGALAQRVLHPSFGVMKTYEAVVRERPGEMALEQLRNGVALHDGVTAPAEARIAGARTVSVPVKKKRPGGPLEVLVKGCVVEIRIHEGKKRIVRRMLKQVGHPVLALRRTAIGALKLGKLESGRTRELSRTEIEKVFQEIKGADVHKSNER